MMHGELAGRTCLVMGAGTGLEVLTAATLGASVIACDINPLTLELLSDAANAQQLRERIELRTFDVCSDAPLPAADLYIFSDLLYTRTLASHIARRCSELLWGCGTPGARVLVTDSQKFHSAAFLDDLHVRAAEHREGATLGQQPIQWQHGRIERFTGSGILIDEDQTYDVELRYLDMCVDTQPAC